MGPITVNRQNTYQAELQFEDEQGQAVDISGCTVRFTVKKQEDIFITGDGSAKIQKDITTHTNAVGGITELSLISIDTDIAEEDYYYDIMLIFPGPSNAVMSCSKDIFTVEQAITQTITL